MDKKLFPLTLRLRSISQYFGAVNGRNADGLGAVLKVTMLRHVIESMYCWGKALQLISPTQAAISLGFNPLSAILLGSFILNEEITLKLIVGFLSIIFAITLANWRIKK